MLFQNYSTYVEWRSLITQFIVSSAVRSLQLLRLSKYSKYLGAMAALLALRFIWLIGHDALWNLPPCGGPGFRSDASTEPAHTQCPPRPRALDAPNVGENAVVLVHPTCGPTQEDDIPGAVRHKTCAPPIARNLAVYTAHGLMVALGVPAALTAAALMDIIESPRVSAALERAKNGGLTA